MLEALFLSSFNIHCSCYARLVQIISLLYVRDAMITQNLSYIPPMYVDAIRRKSEIRQAYFEQLCLLFSSFLFAVETLTGVRL